MFTGIIKTLGHIRALEPRGAETGITLERGSLGTDECLLGASIAVNGVCLTVAECLDDGFRVHASEETLQCTALGGLKAGDAVNLEPALTLSEPLGGHLVSGHVDGIGHIRERREQGESLFLAIEAPPELGRYIAAKGSICVDGISLTVNQVVGSCFELTLIPHTQEVTTIGARQAGDPVNLEVDIIARYLERLLRRKHDL